MRREAFPPGVRSGLREAKRPTDPFDISGRIPVGQGIVGDDVNRRMNNGVYILPLYTHVIPFYRKCEANDEGEIIAEKLIKTGTRFFGRPRHRHRGSYFIVSKIGK